MNTPHRARLIALGAALAAHSAAFAQGVASDAQLETVVLLGRALRAQLPADVPGNLSGRSAEELRLQNLINPEDALAQLPGLTVRKRYVGDRNALLGGRSFGTLQPARALAYVDGYLISNFLGRFDAPRWNMLTPEAIARVDLLQGPFSALLPGNSIGATALVTEREPQRFEAAARLSRHEQGFELYGQRDRLGSQQASAYLAQRWQSGLWASLNLNHQVADSQAMQYFNLLAGAKGWGQPVAGAVPVQGIQYDLDPNGQSRALFGASAGAYDHTEQATAKLKLGAPLGDRWRASLMWAGWQQQSDTHNRSFLRDAQGQTVWAGAVRDADHPERGFVIPNSAFAPSTRQEQHQQWGLSLKTQPAAGWNASLVASGYQIDKDRAHQATLPDPRAFREGGAGSVTRRDGTGWGTLELQALWRGATHRVALGAHHNRYRLDSPSYAGSDWRIKGTTLSQAYRGRTEVASLYAQDAWAIDPDWTLTLGWRSERFRAFEGEQLLRAASCRPEAGIRCEPQADGQFLRSLTYAERRLQGESPKATLAWTVSDEWLLKLSAGRGLRFPNVEELYNASFSATSQTLSDPELRAERGDVLELSAEWQPEAGHKLRMALVHDQVRDAILRQSDATVFPAVTRVSNVDRVRTQAIELVWQAQNLWLKGLSLDANLTLADAVVRANRRDPAQVGKRWPRIPKVRANLLASYRWRDLKVQPFASLGLRHSSRSYGTSNNTDFNSDVYGGTSAHTLLDLRGGWQLDHGIELALGLNNALDQRAYQSHPYPGRTLLAELRWSL